MAKLDVRALALAGGIFWGGGILLIGLAAAIGGVQDGTWYSKAFLEALASGYPGYGGRPEVLDSLVGAAYGFVDGAFCGAVLSALYNLFARRGVPAAPTA